MHDQAMLYAAVLKVALALVAKLVVVLYYGCGTVGYCGLLWVTVGYCGVSSLREGQVEHGFG